MLNTADLWSRSSVAADAFLFKEKVDTLRLSSLPNLTMSSSFSSADYTFIPFTKVPFLLSLSKTVSFSPFLSIIAWCLETAASLGTMSLSGCRPIVSQPPSSRV